MPRDRRAPPAPGKAIGGDVVDGDRVAVLVGAGAIAAPERDFEGQAVDRLARREPRGHRRQDEFRLAIGTVEAKARDRVADGRIGEALDDLFDNSRSRLTPGISGTVGMISECSSFFRKPVTSGFSIASWT
jgi:hypothetical protein